MSEKEKKQYKVNKERCSKCKYSMHCSSGRGNYDLVPVLCGYLLITGESRCFKDGGYREGYRTGYCDKFKPKEVKKNPSKNRENNNAVFRR